MNIFIDENLRRLRAEKGLRQEDLAKHIGISVQSVSKWERGEAMPDIVLLPGIAEFYGVSVDELLGVGKVRREAEIKKFKAEFDALGEKKEFFSQLKLARRIYADYPSDTTVLRCMMNALRQSGYFEESLKFTERLLEEDIDSNARYEAIRNGAFCARCSQRRTVEQARRNLELSERYADMLPNYFETRNQLYVGIHPSTGQAAENIEALMICLCVNIRVLQNEDIQEKIKLWKTAVKLLEIVCDGDYGALTDALLRFYLFIAHDSAILGDREAALEYLEKSAQIALKIDAEPQGTYTAGLLRGRQYTCSGKAGGALRCQMERWAGFAGIREDSEFKAILKKLSGCEETNETLILGEAFAFEVQNLATLECTAYKGNADISGISPISPKDCVSAMNSMCTHLPNCHSSAFDVDFIKGLNTEENDLFALRENGEILAIGAVNKGREITLLCAKEDEREYELIKRMLSFCTKYINDNGHTARLRISIANGIMLFVDEIGYERIG